MSRTLRSRCGIGAGAMVALCLAALSATAQDRPVTTKQDRADTLKLRVSGRINMDYVQRETALMIIDNGSGAASMGFAGNAPVNNSQNTVEGEVTIRFDAELTEKISAVVEIGRLRTDGNGTSAEGVVPFFGDGGDVINDIALREAHLKVTDFLSQGVSMQMGIIGWGFDVRGRGSAMAFNPHYSQRMARNHFDAADSTDGMVARYGISTATELEPLGLHLSYTGGQLTIELVALPVVNEGGPVSQDEALYAVDLWYNLEQQVGKGSRIGAILALSNLDATGPGGAVTPTGSDTQVLTIGAGANLVFQGGIEIFAEGYLQSGAAGRDKDIGAGLTTEFDAAGTAFQIGGRYTAAGENKLWIEASFILYSGDDDGTDDEVNSFMSYENINDFIILEDVYFGLDVDTNYTAFKIMGGLAFGVAGGKDNLELQAGVGFFSTTEDVVMNNSAPGTTDDALGTEIDVKVKYHLSKQARLNLNFGVLSGSDILEDMGGGNTVDGADDSTWLLSLGFDVNW